MKILGLSDGQKHEDSDFLRGIVFDFISDILPARPWQGVQIEMFLVRQNLQWKSILG